MNKFQTNEMAWRHTHIQCTNSEVVFYDPEKQTSDGGTCALQTDCQETAPHTLVRFDVLFLSPTQHAGNLSL